MKLNKKKISYFTVSQLKPNTGIYFKIAGVVDAARELGYEAELRSVRCVKLKDFIQFYSSIVKCDSKYIFLRDIHSWQMIFSYPFWIICRIQGKYLINDIPTPCQAALTESSLNGNLSSVRSSISKFLLLIKGPVPYWFFNKIIQYGNESSYFSFGNKHKTIMLGNGIEKDRVPLREKEYLKHKGELHLLGVANLQVSHGYDRIVRAISEWNKNNTFKAYFHLVSGNAATPVLEGIKKIVNDLHIDKFVFFEPQMNTEQLYEMYGKCDIAIGAIGIHRVGLREASALKLREYCMAGIPFMYSGLDSDFPVDLPFCFQVSNDESINDILKVFGEFSKIRESFTDEDIRQYAIDNLSYSNKLHKLGL